MMGIIDRRVCAETDGPLVLFLIGVRLNRWWKLSQWLPVVLARTKILVEPAKNLIWGFTTPNGILARE
jgi:hypothetical protein